MSAAARARASGQIALLTLLLSGCFGYGQPVTVTMVAVGDIACDPHSADFNAGDGTADRCRMKATAELALALEPTVVAVLGDNQYENGTLEKYQASYHQSWGQLLARTRPAIGNHEYYSGGSGYFAYFGASFDSGDAAGTPAQGYYSYDVGAWHVIVLDSNCAYVGGCGAGSAQEQWLRADLAAHPSRCTLAYWHHPRFSSGVHGDNEAFDAFWRALYQAGAELVLAGHDHHYERFAPQDPDAGADPTRGIRQFVVGTGGRSLRVPPAQRANSEVRSSSDYGVLKLTLYLDSYRWEFVPVDEDGFRDEGVGRCHD